MKNIHKLITYAILICCIGFVSCSDDKESDFDGTDAYFVSFNLKVGEQSYPAHIIDNRMVVTVPSGADLVEAKAEYVLSENAVVKPDPSTITDWYSDQVFRVEAYNSSYTSFVYHLEQEDSSLAGDIVLRTQKDIDAFREKDINKIEGNLIIGTNQKVAKEDSIQSLNGLNSINEVGFNLIINSSFLGENLSGLSNLQKAGGIYIGTADNELVLTNELNISIPQLKSIGNLVIRSNQVKSVLLPELQEASSILIQSQFIEKLEMNDLATCYGSLTINGSQEKSEFGVGNTLKEETANSSLLVIDFPALTSIEGELNLAYLWRTSTLKLPKLTTIGSNCNINTIKNIDKIDLKALQTVQGKLNVFGNDAMTKFYANELVSANDISISSLNEWSINLKELELNKLKSVNKNLAIKYAAITKLDLSALQKVGDIFELKDSQFLEDLNISALSECNQVDFSGMNMLSQIDFSKISALEKISLVGIRSIEKIDLSSMKEINNITIGACNNLKVVVGPQTVTDLFNITNSSKQTLTIKRTQKTGMFSLASIEGKEIIIQDLLETGKFSINNCAIATLLETTHLQKVASFEIMKSYNLTKTNFPKLTTVEGEFSFRGGSWKNEADKSMTTNLNGFSSLTKAGSIEVLFGGHLNDFSGLKNVIKSIKEEDWYVEDNKYNPTYQDMLDGKYTENEAIK